jgi:copper transport protein
LLAAGALAPSAHAHARLVRSQPADAVSLEKPPRLIRLWFSEPLSPSVSVVRLRDARGDVVPGLELDTAAAGSGALALAVPKLPRGAYSLEWRVLSEDDVHFSNGGIVFGVGADASLASRPASATAVDGADVVFRWLGLLLLAGMVGGLAVATLVLGPLADSEQRGSVSEAATRARARALGWTAFCAANAVVLGVAILLWQTSSLTTASSPAEKVAWELLSDSRWGTLWIAREAILVALVVALFVVLRARPGDTGPPRRTLALSVAGLLALSLVVVQALGSHASALNGAATIVVAGVHLLAAAVWVGGLLALVVSLWPLLGRRRSESAALARACLGPFSLLAVACVGLLAVTGLYYAGREVASLDALLTTLYGKSLLVKLGLVLAVGVLGLLTTLVLRPHLASPVARLLRRPAGWTPVAPTHLRSLLVAEAALGLAVLLLVGLLTASPPARGPEFAPAQTAPPSFRSTTVDDLLVSLSVKPNRPGANVFEVGAVSTRRPAPREIQSVRLVFTSGERTVVSKRLDEVKPGRYRLGGEYLNEAGPWRIEALVGHGGLQASQVSFDWTVESPVPPRPVLVSSRPLEPILTRAAALLLFCLAIACAWLLVLRLAPRDRRAPVDPPIIRRLEEKAK